MPGRLNRVRDYPPGAVVDAGVSAPVMAIADAHVWVLIAIRMTSLLYVGSPVAGEDADDPSPHRGPHPLRSLSDLAHVARLDAPVELELVAEAARDDVEVEMPHRLRRALAIGLHEVDAVGGKCPAHALRHLLRGGDGVSEPFRRQVEQAGRMVFRDDQRVARVGGVDIHEGQRAVILEQFEARDVAGDDLAEDAVLVVHGYFPSRWCGMPRTAFITAHSKIKERIRRRQSVKRGFGSGGGICS